MAKSKTFKASLEAYAKLTKTQMKYVAVNAIQDVLEAAQTPQLGLTKGATSFVEGKIPVAESELINSLTSEGITGPTSYTTALAGYEVGDVMTFAWTAPHALPMETGYTHYKSKEEIPGRHFVGKNAERFDEFVKAREKEL